MNRSVNNPLIVSSTLNMHMDNSTTHMMVGMPELREPYIGATIGLSGPVNHVSYGMTSKDTYNTIKQSYDYTMLVIEIITISATLGLNVFGVAAVLIVEELMENEVKDKIYDEIENLVYKLLANNPEAVKSLNAYFDKNKDVSTPSFSNNSIENRARNKILPIFQNPYITPEDKASQIDRVIIDAIMEHIESQLNEPTVNDDGETTIIDYVEPKIPGRTREA